MNVKHLLSAAIGVLAGALLTWRLLDVGAGSNAQMGSNVDDSALHNELHLIHRSQAGIAEALQSIAKALSDQTLAPVAPLGGRIATEPVTPASLHELTVSLEQLRESIEAESRRTQEVIRNAPVFGGESLNELRDRTADTNWTDLEALEENWRSDPTATARSQHFQSARDLLEAYGPPNAIYRPKGGLHYVYRRHPEGDAGVAWYFRLQDGYVVNFFVEDEPASDG